MPGLPVLSPIRELRSHMPQGAVKKKNEDDIKIKTIHGFYICQFTYLLKFICDSKINTRALSRSFVDRRTCETHTFPAEVKQVDLQPSCFSSHTEMTRGWRWLGTVQFSPRSSISGASWMGFESQFWCLLVGQPQASHLTLLFCERKKMESTRMSCF